MKIFVFKTKSGHFIAKNEANDSARDGLGVEDGSEVVCLGCSKEFMFFSREDVGWGLITE